MSAANRVVYYSAASNINSWNIFRIASPETIKYDFPYLLLFSFFFPPWSLQNMIEYLRSLGVNNRLHIDVSCMHCCRALTDRMHQGVICCGCQDWDRVPAHISLSYRFTKCKCKNTETINLRDCHTVHIHQCFSKYHIHNHLGVYP